MPTLIVVPDLTRLAISRAGRRGRSPSAGCDRGAVATLPDAPPVSAPTHPFDRLAAALTARADRLARARQRRPEGHRWRSAPYLWPLFAN